MPCKEGIFRYSKEEADAIVAAVDAHLDVADVEHLRAHFREVVIQIRDPREANREFIGARSCV